jgi:poly(3-hydroxyalkanoate) synthetase
MNLDAIEKHCEQQSQVKQEWCMSKSYKPQSWWAETYKCYNCESSNILQEPARSLNKRKKKLQQQIHT